MPRRTTAIGVLALVACVALTGCQGSSASVERLAPPAAPSPAPAAEPEPARVITLAFAGDTHFQLHLAALARPPARRARADHEDTPGRRSHHAQSRERASPTAGLRIPRSSRRRPTGTGSGLRPRRSTCCRRAGVDVVTMANNHGADYGPEGLRTPCGRPSRPDPGRRHRPGPRAPPSRRTASRSTTPPVAFLAADASPREAASRVWEAGARTPGIAAARGRGRRRC